MILADEHVPKSLIDVVSRSPDWFKVLRATHDPRFRGRNERDYIGELRALNIVFITQDGEFVRSVISARIRHAGIIWLPARARGEVIEALFGGALGLLRGYLDNGTQAAHDVIIRVGYDGIYEIVGGRQMLVASLQRMKDDVQRVWGERILTDV